VSSAVADIVISAARYHYLRELKQGYIQCVTLAARTTPFKVNFVVDRTREVVDTVMVFTINDGLLTSALISEKSLPPSD
jgi:hypothetical protein